MDEPLKTESEFMEAARRVWEDVGPDEPWLLQIPPALAPYVRLNERGEFASLDRSDGFVDKYEAEVRRQMRETPIYRPRPFAPHMLWDALPEDLQELVGPRPQEGRDG